ncbi:MAG: hypothetical protein VW268_00990 [Rhodospirillaceae bacterium]
MIALSRFVTGANNPQMDTAPPRWRLMDQRVLANTVEQTLVFIPLLLAAATAVYADETAYLIAVPIVFGAARDA